MRSNAAVLPSRPGPDTRARSGRRSLRPAAFSLAALGLLALGAACRTVPKVPGADVQILYSGTLEEARPVDVVVAPIENSSGSSEVPERTLRQALVDGLVKRRYSPLALEYVDRQVVEASYTPGSLREDAVFQVEILRWDTSRWESEGALEVTMEGWMLDASQPGRAELWGGRLTERMLLDPEISSFGASSALHAEVCERLSAKLLEAMPARTAKP